MIFKLIKSFIQKNKPWSWILILFILVPVFLQMHWWPIYQMIVFLTPGNHDTWIQFWGSYLGIIPSGLVAYMLASKQIESSKDNDKKNYLENLYLDDLRKIKGILLLHRFSGQWNSPYNNGVIGSFVDIEIDMFRKMFLKITNDGDTEIIKTDELFDIKTIVHGLPSSKREEIQIDVDIMCDEILRLAGYKPGEFKKMEVKYLDTAIHKNESEIQMRQFESADKNWKEHSKLFWEHIEIITDKFNKLDKFVNDELAIYYKL